MGADTIGDGSNFRHEVFRLVIDGAIGAESDAGIALFLRSGGHNYLGAERFCNLDGCDAYAGGSTVNKDGFARLQSPALENIVPDRHECLGNGCGSDHTYSGWDRERMGFMRRAVLRVTATSYERHDFVADLESSCSFACRDNLTGDLEAENIAGPGGGG